MKKVYMPSNDDLRELYSMGANINQYVKIKAAETIMAGGKNYPAKGMLNGCYQYLKDDPEIVRAVCYTYPKEIAHSEIAKYDVELLRRLLTKVPSKSIHNIDYCHKFSESVKNNPLVIEQILSLLAREIYDSPEYRFEYQSDETLDSIFDCQLNLRSIPCLGIGTMMNLAAIEPAYIIALKNGGFGDTYDNNEYSLIKSGFSSYVSRYGLQYNPNDRSFELDNQSSDMYRLIRMINRENKN